MLLGVQPGQRPGLDAQVHQLVRCQTGVHTHRLVLVAGGLVMVTGGEQHERFHGEKGSGQLGRSAPVSATSCRSAADGPPAARCRR